MKQYYLSQKEYDEVFDKVIGSASHCIKYHGLIVQAEWISEYQKFELTCAYQKDILAHNYEWFIIPNPQDFG